MPREFLNQAIDWISLNFANGVYLAKDFILLNLGMAVEPSDTFMDNLLEWMIGVSLVAFNIVRIWKWIIDIKEKKQNETK